MKADQNESRPKYGCADCGSDEVRGDFDTYQVFIAKGDKLIHIGSDFVAGGITGLYCLGCGESIEVEDCGRIQIE